MRTLEKLEPLKQDNQMIIYSEGYKKVIFIRFDGIEIQSERIKSHHCAHRETSSLIKRSIKGVLYLH